MYSQYRVGDRVKYVGNTAGKWQQESMIGQIGTVKDKRNGNIFVEWDNGALVARNPRENNIELVRVPSKASINSAIEILKAAGKLEFTPFKPPFIPIELQISCDYHATITDQEVIVGCQHISFGTVIEVYNAVMRAREYKNEK